MAATSARGRRPGWWWVLALLVPLVAVLPAAPVRSAVPTPAANETVITVKVGSDTLPTTGASPVAGVVLRLADTNGNPLTDPWAQCTSDADGDCSFTVPDTAVGGANNGRRFIVQGVSAPAGYQLNPKLDTGGLSGPWTAQQYQFQTAAAQGGQTQLSGRDFMTLNAGTQGSTGVWQVSRVNPEPSSDCGLKVALILDFSSSVTSSDFAALKQVAQSFVDALSHTPSSVAVYSFSTTSTENVALTPVATTAQATGVKNQIGALTQTGGYTNWDSAFTRVASSADNYDVAVMITDGNPTVSDAEPSTSSASTRFSIMERSIFSANALKAEGTRIVAFGIGSGVASSADNLAAISGPVEDSDYYIKGDYAGATADLKTLAQGSCRPSITVIKEVLPPGATSTAGGQPAGGWTFTASASGATVTGSTSKQTADDGTGATNFPLGFANPTDTATIGLVETQQPGYTLFPADAAGDNATCTDIDTGDTVAVTNDATGPGFSVQMNGDQGVSCTVYNVAPTPIATLQIDKDWVVNGTSYANGEQPAGLGAGLTIDGERVRFGTVNGPYDVGTTVTVDEATRVFLPLCTLTGSSLVVDGTTYPAVPADVPLPTEGPHTGTLTNTVTCTSRLTLVKQVQGGPADPESWNLTGTGPTGDLPGPDGTTGSPGATATVTPNDQYALSETGGDPRYAQLDNRTRIAPVPGSTGSWHCQFLNAAGQPFPLADGEGVNGGVTVELGEWQQCMATNQTSTLDLSKIVDNTGGGTLSPEDWTLTATPEQPAPAGLGPESVTGSTNGESFLIRPLQPYSITESGPAGYHGTLRCDTGPGGGMVVTDHVTALALSHHRCQFTNTFEAPVPPPSTGPPGSEPPPTGPGTGPPGGHQGNGSGPGSGANNAAGGLPTTGSWVFPVLMAGAGLTLSGALLLLGLVARRSRRAAG